MSLDKIINKIKESANEEASKILGQADLEIKELEAAGENRFKSLGEEKKKEEIVADTELKNAILLPARLEVRGAELAAKQGTVDRVFRESMEFGSEEYKRVLKTLYSQVPTLQDATIFPAEGKEEITNEFVRENNITAKVEKPVKDLMGGFLLKAGKVEYDCSFVTLLKNLRNKLETEVAQELAK